MVNLGCGGASMMKRVVAAAVFGIFIGLSYMIMTIYLGYHDYANTFQLGIACLWRLFVFALFAGIGALIMEFRLEHNMA
jgi:ABC-type multidrug transport system permease subunit